MNINFISNTISALQAYTLKLNKTGLLPWRSKPITALLLSMQFSLSNIFYIDKYFSNWNLFALKMFIVVLKFGENLKQQEFWVCLHINYMNVLIKILIM